MRILILAGGKGTRLLPLTKYAPKIMMSIHGQPFLYYLLRAYRKHDIVLSVNYMKEAIKNWCRFTKNYLEFVEEPEYCGTGGAIRMAQQFLANKRRFAVVNGDTYLKEPLEKIAKAHNYKKDVATVVYAKSVLDGKKRNAGVYIFSQEIFDYVQRPKFFNIEDKFDKIPVKVYESKEGYLDIGSYEGLKFAKKKMFRKEFSGQESK